MQVQESIVISLLNCQQLNTLCSKKSDAKIKSLLLWHILLESIIPLTALIIAFLEQTLQILTKSTARFLSNSFLKNGT